MAVCSQGSCGSLIAYNVLFWMCGSTCIIEIWSGCITRWAHSHLSKYISNIRVVEVHVEVGNVDYTGKADIDFPQRILCAHVSSAHTPNIPVMYKLDGVW